LILIEESIVKLRDSISFSVFLSNLPDYEIHILIPRQAIEKIVPSPNRSIDERFDVHRELFMEIANRLWNNGILSRDGHITISELDEIDPLARNRLPLAGRTRSSEHPLDHLDAKQPSIQPAATF
ncbi:MAG: hypothetical protein B7Z80_21005, partial [Rhodospirillales bacterium 20-64-7]